MRSVRSLLSGSAFLTLARIGGGGVGFLTQILLANVLGAHDLGVFYSATSLAIAAGYVTTGGYSQIAARFAARYRPAGKGRLFAAFIARASLDSLTLAVLAAAAVIAGALLVPGLDRATRISYGLGGALIVATSCLTLYTNLAGAVRRFGLCYLPEGIVRPFAFLVLAGAMALALPRPTSADATALYLALTGTIAVVQLVAIRRSLPGWRSPAPSDRHVGARWRREAWPLVLLSLYTNAFADIGILCATPFLRSADVAAFGICLKLSMLVGYVVQVTQQMAVPDLADARLARDRDAMQGALRRAVLLPTAVTLAATAVCALFGREILGLFGRGFGEAGAVLVIAVASQLLRALAGPSPHLLTLTGAQGVNARICAGALLVLLGGNLVLTARFGLVGAAWSVFGSYAVWIAATSWVVWRMGEGRTDALAVLVRPQPAPALTA